MFNVRKVAQMAAYFLHSNDDGPMDHVKLMKLMYLSDRRALATFRFPISDDTYCSMRRGPVLEKTLSLFEGRAEPNVQAVWNLWISGKENHQIRPNRKVNIDDFDRFAGAELEVMGKTFSYFGGWDWKDLVEYTHGLPEWENLGKDAKKTDSKPLSLTRIMNALVDVVTKEPLSPDEVASTVRYMEEVEPNVRLITTVKDFNSRKRPDPKVSADALEELLGV